MINGSDTSLYPPFITKDSILRGYEADICRSVYMVFKKEDQVNGINGLRFGLPEGKQRVLNTAKYYANAIPINSPLSKILQLSSSLVHAPKLIFLLIYLTP